MRRREGRPFVVALVVLDPDAARTWAQRRHIEFSSLVDLARHAELTAEIEAGVEDVMADFNHAERVKKVRILGEEWLPDSEELTPTSKLKRGGVRAKYATEIDSLYAAR